MRDTAIIVPLGKDQLAELFAEGFYVVRSMKAAIRVSAGDKVLLDGRKEDGLFGQVVAVQDDKEELELELITIIPAYVPNQLPPEWVKALVSGWKIMLTSCMCGGRYAWFQPSAYGGGERAFGCVCHNRPTVG